MFQRTFDRSRCHILVQCRVTSTRLRGKCFLPLNREPLISCVVKRMSQVRMSGLTAVIFPETAENDELEELFVKTGVPFFRGPEDDVLARYKKAVQRFGTDTVVRVTGDNPLIHAGAIDGMLKVYIKSNCDYVFCDGLPLGCGAEVVRGDAIMSIDPHEQRYREHVTLFIRENPQRFDVQTYRVTGLLNRPELRLTVDEKKDYELIKCIYDSIGNSGCVSLEEAIAFLDEHPEIAGINRDVSQKIP